MGNERFDEKLIRLLKTYPDFVDDSGELLRDKIKILAWAFDHHRFRYIETHNRS